MFYHSTISNATMPKTRKNKSLLICPGCSQNFNKDSDLLSHMRKNFRCRKSILQCVACSKEYTSQGKLHGHLGHYSSKNCLALHNNHEKRSHTTSVTNILPQTLAQFPVHQSQPQYSAQALVGRILKVLAKIFFVVRSE